MSFKPKKYFNLDLHISVIQDIIYIFNKLFGPTVKIINWSISGHNWVFGKSTQNVKIINQYSWRNINHEMITEFQKEYDEYLEQFDGFIVTHTPVLAMIYEKYKKPIIMINSCRYDQPFCWSNKSNEWLNAGLKRMYNSGQLIAISNNKGDQQYLLDGANIPSIHIPSLCLYTGVKYKPVFNAQFVCYGDRKIFPKSSLLVEKPASGYTWNDLYSYKGIVHVPYEISTMSLFEQYSAGVPLFLPSKEFYKKCIENGIMQLGSDYSTINKKGIDYWLDRADYYDSTNFTEIYYYNSFIELIYMLENYDKLPSRNLININNRSNEILLKWSEILYNIYYMK